jgi:hypothetical protein
MKPYLSLAALTLGLAWASGIRADAGLAGHWQGEGSDDSGQRYEIEIAIGRDGGASFEYALGNANLVCTGSLALVGREEEAFVYRDALTRGPASCPSYGRVTLKPRSDGTWLTYDRFGGGFTLRGELRGFRLTVKPETCVECAQAQKEDEVGCRYLAEKEQRDEAANKVCFESAVAFAASCRKALRCPASGP